MFALPALALGALTSACGGNNTSPPQSEVPQAVQLRSAQAADLFQSRLQAALQHALRDGGPENAVSACAEAAPVIASEVSAETGAQIRRVALRPRNPAAKTDGMLTQHLQALADHPLDAKGQPAMVNWVEGKGATESYVSMRAIVMKAAPCGLCHGTAVSPSVRAAIARRYPGDQATGFHPGMLRGAILIQWPPGYPPPTRP